MSSFISDRMLDQQSQHTNTHRQAVRDFYENIGIPLKDMMAMLDMDYASEAQTCGSDTDVLESTTDWRVKVGLGQMVKKVVGMEWRSPDVSEDRIYCPYVLKLT